MAEELIVRATRRVADGSVEAGRLRRQGLLPAVVYGDGKKATTIQVKAHELEQILRHHASGNVLLDLELEGKTAQKVLLKEAQHHPLTGRLIHADFHTISMTERLRIQIPVHFVGEPVGVTQEGGILEHLLWAIEVECLPADILESVQLDVSGLHIGHSMTVAAIPIDPAKYHVITAQDVAVAAVTAPKIEEEVAATPAEGAEGAPTEPEVITARKEKEEEGGEEGAEKEKGKERGGKEKEKDEGRDREKEKGKGKGKGKD